MTSHRAVITLISAVAVLALASASPASAAKVSLKDADTFATLTYKAAAGEANNVVFKLRARSIEVTDAGARIRAGKGCKRRAKIVECAVRGTVIRHTVQLGDGDDRARLRRAKKATRSTSLSLEGGDGDDVLDGRRATHPTSFLRGGAGNDRITGSPDGDVIDGGAGSDRLVGRDGADQFTPDGADSTDDDVLIGGAGSDGVAYKGRAKAVSVDLRRASPQGGEGESDTFDGIENVGGGDGDDVILGNETANDLLGGAGKDEIRGFGGDDRVWGEDEDGADTLDAGPGRDIVNSDAPGSTGQGGDGDDSLNGRGTLDGGAGRDNFDPEDATVICGADEDDVLIDSNAPSALDASCEEIAFGQDRALSMTLPLEREEGGLVARLGCFEDDTGEVDTAVCSGEITASLGETVVAGGAFSGAEGPRDVPMPYRPGGKEALGAAPKQVRLAVGAFTIDVVV